jgi:DNA repair protein RadC
VANKPIIVNALDSYVLFKQFFDDDTINLQESFLVMYSNRINRILGIYPMTTGGISGTVVDIRLIFSVALTTASTAFILAHNHTSGNMKSSQADIALTRRIKETAKLMEIKLLDHLIISPAHGEYYSFADEGVL